MSSESLVKVWDLPTRVFHWLLVVSFFVAYLSEDRSETLHVWSGYLVLVLLVFRLIWGFVGNEYAKFNQFVCSPIKSIEYIKGLIAGTAKRYLGHNPAGALMIVLLLLSLLMTVITGLAAYGSEGHGVLGFIDNRFEDVLEEVHELFANFTLVLVGIHVFGVAVECFIHRENLVRAMFHGNKRQ
ncbi:putative Ni/Fe-hydrogenase B-type cytochrome subunit [Patescibacteria group bacterium]|nr:putative Ni/Fe-hydrogenase B-type cytochrome subunit [Patescibacteria group bacterium]